MWRKEKTHVKFKSLEKTDAKKQKKKQDLSFPEEMILQKGITKFVPF
jgi:hypothetical protein